MNDQAHSGCVALPRALSWLADAVVILTSCKDEDVLNGCGLGASRYVRKLVDFGEFAVAISSSRGSGAC